MLYQTWIVNIFEKPKKIVSLAVYSTEKEVGYFINSPKTIRRVAALNGVFCVEMWRRVIGNVAVRRQLHRALSSKSGGSGKSGNVSAAVDSMLLRSLKEHYLEVSKMTPPPVRSSSSLSLSVFLSTFRLKFQYPSCCFLHLGFLVGFTDFD